MSAVESIATTTGPQPPILIDLTQFSAGVGLLVAFSSGAVANVNVEVTGSPTPLVASARWNLHDVLNGLTASKNSSLAYPVTAIRLNVQSITPPGSVSLAVVQHTSAGALSI